MDSRSAPSAAASESAAAAAAARAARPSAAAAAAASSSPGAVAAVAAAAVAATHNVHAAPRAAAAMEMAESRRPPGPLTVFVRNCRLGIFGTLFVIQKKARAALASARHQPAERLLRRSTPPAPRLPP